MGSRTISFAIALVCGIVFFLPAPHLAAQTCKDTTLVATSATFALRTDERGAYDDNLRCRWTLKPPQARQIMLQLTNLDIYEDDTLRVFGSKDPTRVLGEITGLDPAGTYIFEDSTITVQFVSGPEEPGYYRAGGWTILYASSQRPPNIRTETDRIIFEEIPFGTSSKILNTRITIANALNNVVIVPPTGFKVSASPTGPFLDTLRVNAPRDVTASSQLYVQFVPPSADEFSGRISISIGSAETFINVSGIAPPAIYWEPSNGPFSGRVQALGIAAGNTLLAGTSSGIYRSNSNGAVWLQNNTGLTSKKSQEIQSIASWQRNIAILTEAGLYRSQDSGRSWKRMPTTGLQGNATNATVLLNFAGNLLIGTEEGVYRFISDAAGWQGINKKLPSNEKPYVTALAEHNGRLFVAVSDEDDVLGVFASADSARTWVLASGPKDSLNLPLDDQHSIVDFATVGARLYALVDTYDDNYDFDYSELYFSDDNGETWIVDDDAGLTEYSYFGGFYEMMSVGQTLYLGTADGVFRRLNAGKVAELKDIAPWQQINRGINELTAQALAANGSTLYVGTYGGVFRSNNQGASWVAVNQGLTASLVFAMEEHRGAIIAGTEGSGMFRSIDNGISWVSSNSGLPARYIGDIFSNEVDLFACAYLDERTNGVYRSFDNGASWTKLADFPTSNRDPSPLSPKPNVYTVAIDSRGYLFAGGSIGGESDAESILYYSTNNGVTWIDATLPSAGLAYPVYALEEVLGLGMLVGTFGGGVFAGIVSPLTRTVSWQKILFSNGSNNEADYIRGFATYRNIVFAATDDGLYRLNRGRLLWERVEGTPDLVERSILSIHIAGGMLYVGTLGGGVWRTSGQRWERVQDGLVNNADIYSLTSDDFNLYAGLSGNAIYRSSLRLPATAARAELEISDNFGAAPGDSVSITITMGGTRNLPSAQLPSVSGILRFNASLLDPGEALRAEAVVNGERLLPFQAPLKARRGEVIKTFKFRALLGNSVATPLTLTNLSASGVLLTTIRPGLFTLKGLSDAGGTRLFVAESKPLLSISPNPASALASVKVETFEYGETILTIANTFGQTLKTFTTQNMEPGVYDFSAVTSEMPQGVYFVTLQTPTYRITRQLQVVK